MNLYCWPHNEVHRFTAGEVERIVYALTGAAADAATTENSHAIGEPSHEHLDCPREALRGSYDPEVYQEHVSQGVECRRRG